jgi:hypothetical protein
MRLQKSIELLEESSSKLFPRFLFEMKIKEHIKGAILFIPKPGELEPIQVQLPF